MILPKEKSIFYFPGWTRKSLCFTIDDGYVPMDRKFLDITEPAGLRGTFNLFSPLGWFSTTEGYAEFYGKYEIANHCRYHAYPLTPETNKPLGEGLFGQTEPDRAFRYRTEEEGVYRVYTYDWTYVADDDKFSELVVSCERDLEAIFGKGKIRGFVWPCGEQQNPRVFEMLKAHGFQSIRKTGCVGDSAGFDMPEDRMRWSYTADCNSLIRLGELYESYPDDGKLKFFCFGVHSSDFEGANKWDDLRDFCNKFGNRPDEYYYAGVGEIMDYEDAVNEATVTPNEITNNSDVTLYAIVNGKKITVSPKETVCIG